MYFSVRLVPRHMASNSTTFCAWHLGLQARSASFSFLYLSSSCLATPMKQMSQSRGLVDHLCCVLLVLVWISPHCLSFAVPRTFFQMPVRLALAWLLIELIQALGTCAPNPQREFGFQPADPESKSTPYRRPGHFGGFGNL